MLSHKQGHRVQLTDSLLDIIVKLSQGNPGAVTVLAQWVKDGEAIDPQSCHPMIAMCRLDDMDIVGARIWMLYKDVCGQDLRRFIGVLRANQLGFLAEADLDAAIDGHRPIDVASLVLQVEAELSEFKRSVQPVSADAVAAPSR